MARPARTKLPQWGVEGAKVVQNMSSNRNKSVSKLEIGRIRRRCGKGGLFPGGSQSWRNHRAGPEHQGEKGAECGDILAILRSDHAEIVVIDAKPATINPVNSPHFPENVS